MIHIHGIVLQASQLLCQYRFLRVWFSNMKWFVLDKAARMESMKEDPAFLMRLYTSLIDPPRVLSQPVQQLLAVEIYLGGRKGR